MVHMLKRSPLNMGTRTKEKNLEVWKFRTILAYLLIREAIKIVRAINAMGTGM
jgi:hypothetical protein